MTADARPFTHRVSELTRRNPFDALTVADTTSAGRMGETKFPSPVFDLARTTARVPGTRGRYDRRGRRS